MKKYIVAFILTFYTLIAHAATTPAETAALKETSQKWAQALASGNPEQMAALYDFNAQFYPTFENKVSTREDLENYFTKLMKHENLRVKFIQQNIRVREQTAVNSGLYEFSYQDQGHLVKLPARYTFVYHLEPTGWLIVDHHSSALPIDYSAR